MKNRQLFSHVWWSKPKDEVAHSVFALVEATQSDQTRRVDAERYHVSLYDDRPYGGVDFSDWSNIQMTGDEDSNPNDLTYNVCKSVVDTLISRITKHKPRPVFLTSGGDWSEQRRAKKLTKFVDGQFVSLKAYELARLAFRDACVFGTGIVKLQLVGKKIEASRVLPHQIVVSNEESHLAAPRQLHHVYEVHSEVLAALFPKRREEILAAIGSNPSESSTSWQLAASSAASCGMVTIIESWHLRSDDESGDGRHTICIQGACLLDEEWTTDRFPFAFIHYDKPMLGFWGKGVVESLRDIQSTLNEMVALRAQIIRNTAVPAFLVKRNINTNDIIDNRLFKIIKVDEPNDVKPVSFGILPPEIVSQMSELFEKAYRLAGVSEMSSQGKKPSGLDAAVAMREFEDIESDRFAVIQQQYEEFILDLARHLIRLAKEAKDEGVDIETKRSGKKFFESIRWSEIDLDDTKYDMALFSSSHLPRTPAARLQHLQELLNMGIIDKDEFLRQLDVKDLEQVADMKNARLDDLYETVERFLDGGEYEPPEPFQDLNKGIEIFHLTYLQNRRIAPEDVLERIRTWIVDATALLGTSAPPPAPPMPPPMEPPMAPQGMPITPPGAPGVLPPI
jgi:hypothetical protein